MPLTQEQKTQLLKSNGYDPLKHEMDDDGNVYELATDQAEPTVSMDAVATQEAASSKPKTTTLGAAAANFTRGLLPTGAALAAGGYATAATAPLLGPAAVIPGIGASILASMGVSGIQDKVLPQGAKDYLMAAEEEHPYASFGGNIASALPAMRIDPRAISSAARGVTSAVRGQGITPAQTGNLLNVGVGAGAGAGIPIYEGIQEGDIDPAKVLLGLASGALINNPRAWASQAFRLSPNVYDTDVVSANRPPADITLDSNEEVLRGFQASRPPVELEGDDIVGALAKDTARQRALQGDQLEIEAPNPEAERINRQRINDEILLEDEYSRRLAPREYSDADQIAAEELRINKAREKAEKAKAASEAKIAKEIDLAEKASMKEAELIAKNYRLEAEAKAAAAEQAVTKQIETTLDTAVATEPLAVKAPTGDLQEGPKPGVVKKTTELPPVQEGQIIGQAQSAPDGLKIKLGKLDEGGFINPEIVKEVADWAKANLKFTSYDDFSSGMRSVFSTQADKLIGPVWEQIKPATAPAPVKEEVRYSGVPAPEIATKALDTLQSKTIKSVNAKVAEIGTPSAKYASEKLQKKTALQGYYEGKYGESPKLLLESHSPDIQQRVYNKLVDQDISGTPATFTADETKLADDLRKWLVGIHDDQRRLNMKIDGRNPKDNPNYFPSVMSAKVQDVIANTPPSNAQHQKYKKLITDYWISQEPSLAKIDPTSGKTEAELRFKEYVVALSSKGRNLMDSAKFGALRKAEGLGLPKEVREENIARALERYGRRVATDLSYHEALESDPAMRKILNLKDPATGTINTADVTLPGTSDLAEELVSIEDVGKAISVMFGEVPRSKNQQRIVAAQRLVSNSMLGIPTGLRDLATLPVNAVPFIKKGDYGVFLKALNRMNDVRGRALKAGATKQNLQEITFGPGATDTTNDPIINGMNRTANWMYRWLGRGPLENLSREYAFALGEELTALNLARAKAGDKEAQDLLKKLGTAVEGGIEQYFTAGKAVDNETVARTAKRFVDLVQQSYDANDLPHWAIEGDAAPWFSMARWSIGKANVIHDNVVMPALKTGNYGPLLTYTLGTFLSGAAIQELNKFLNNRKDFNPEIKELWAKPENTKELVSGIMNLAQMGSFYGIFGDLARMVGNKVTGQPVRGFGVPLVESVTSIANTLTDWYTAIEEGANPVESTIQLGYELLKNNVQSARMVLNNTVNAEETEQKDTFRDLAIFERLSGRNELDDQGAGNKSRANPFADKDVKKFKKTEDLGEAADLLGNKIVPSLVEKFADNPAKLVSKLRGLKSNSSRTFPSPETDPQGFVEYYDFLKETQGEEVAKQRAAEFLQKREINKVKSSLVPTI